MGIKRRDKLRFTHVALAMFLFLLGTFYSIPPHSTDLLGLGFTWIVNRQCQRSPDKVLKICSFDVFQTAEQRAIAIFYNSNDLPLAINLRFGEVSLKAQLNQSLVGRRFFVLSNSHLITRQFKNALHFPNLPTRDFRFVVEPEFSEAREGAQVYNVRVF